MYKISIIMPIFNVERYLKRSLDSILNQTMNINDIEVIMVDDCSTDNSRKIIEEYANKYPNFIGIFHEENSGNPAAPRNTGLKNASGDYIMFLDPDDEYFLDACETLYDTIFEYDVDVAFGRYVKVYDNQVEVQKSYSPFNDDMVKKYPNLKFDTNNSKGIKKFINESIGYVVYGIKSNEYYSNHKKINVINIDNINQKPIILKMAASAWTKIYKKEFIIDNNIKFPLFRLGEDYSFVLDAFLKANGIVFLNNFLVCKYSVRESEGDESVTKNITFKLLYDGLDNYSYCSNLVNCFSKEIRIFSVSPHLPYWFSLWRKSNLSKKENKQLIEKLYELKEVHNVDFKTRFLFSFITTFIKISNYF